MLKGISPLLSPALLKILAEMGHGDRIVLADSSFPGASLAKKHDILYLRESGCGIPELLNAILALLPLDTNVRQPVTFMNSVGQANQCEIPIWKEYEKILAQHDPRRDLANQSCDRYAFYEQVKDAYCILQTGETAIYANVILQKGFV